MLAGHYHLIAPINNVSLGSYREGASGLRRHISIYIFLIHFFILTGIAGLYRCFLATQSELLSVADYFKVFFLGITFDFTVAVYTFFPLAIVLLIFNRRSLEKATFRRTLISILAFELFVALFTAVSEFMFFGEFNDRFNFIAVDYLVYTNEVLRNIWESYRLVQISISIIVITVVVSYFFYKKVFKRHPVNPLPGKEKAIFISVYTLVFALLVQFVNENQLLSALQTADSILLSKNGFHSLFAAYRNNEISFDKYYPTLDAKEAIRIVHSALESADHEAYEQQSSDVKEDEYSVVRNIVASGPPEKKNVVLVLMESLSAKYLGAYGNTQSLTPNLDKLTEQGLFLERAYSTGTRTVRGIEAVALSIPPTPGQSIVRRPAGTGLFNIGTVFKQYGYENKFIYGGNALFDNMGTFFSGNGFEVVDKGLFTSEEIHFDNAWGVCDEDLFNKVISEADASYAKKTPFFSFVLTTSNHRPYTYPLNKIDIPSGSGRDGAIKYSDYAIGEFLKNVQKKPWFKDTVFIFISDHNASVAGGDQIQIEDYRIPIIFYSPSFIQPRKLSHLVSQIDLAPTLFSLLNFSYQSRFFGVNALENYAPRAFMGTYKKIAYYNNEELIVFSPTKIVEKKPGEIEKKEVITSQDPVAVQTAVAFYKVASDLFRESFLLADKKFATNFNKRRTKR